MSICRGALSRHGCAIVPERERVFLRTTTRRRPWARGPMATGGGLTSRRESRTDGQSRPESVSQALDGGDAGLEEQKQTSVRRHGYGV